MAARVQLDALQRDLGAFLSTGHDPGPAIASVRLPAAVLPHVARQNAIAAVRATSALARAKLPADRAVLRSGKAAVRQLRSTDPLEAKRYARMLKRPRRRRQLYWGARAFLGLLGLGLLFLTIPLGSFSLLAGSSTDRALGAALAFLAFFWPYIQRFNVAGFGLERAPLAPEPAAVGADLTRNAALAARLIGRLVPPAVPTESVRTAKRTADSDSFIGAGDQVGDGARGRDLHTGAARLRE